MQWHASLSRRLNDLADLPTTVTLDDSVSMSPQMKLSAVPEVVVVARVSKSGTAGAQAGDLGGMSVPVKPSKQTIDISMPRWIEK